MTSLAQEDSTNLETPSDLIDAPRNIAARNRQEALWSETNVDARQQLHMREAALAYKSRFQLAMSWYNTIKFMIDCGKQYAFHKLHPGLIELIVRFAYPQHDGLVLPLVGLKQRNSRSAQDKVAKEPLSSAGDTERESSADSNQSMPFKLFVRTRPILEFERAQDEYKVISTEEEHTIQLHDGRVDRTGRRLNMRHFQFSFDRVFSPLATNQEVCEETISKLFKHASVEKKNATIIFYGQTGTGKTYTMNGMIQWLCKHIQDFNDSVNDSKNEEKSSPKDAQVFITPSLTFFEVHGSKAYDLLQDRKIIKLLSDRDGKVHPRGAKTVVLESTASEKYKMMAILENALKLRSIEVTERNPISSRSHAILTISLGQNMGSIRLVDLAGSERNYETIKMTPKMHRESADINKSLFALKDCFRAYNTLSKGLTRMEYQIKVPLMSSVNIKQKERQTVLDVKGKKMMSAKVRLNYRAHMLTRCLRECFSEKNHITHVVACLSPTSTDIEHSLNTLNHVSLMNKEFEKMKFVLSVSVLMYDAVVKSKSMFDWSPEDVQRWITTVDGGVYSHVVLPPTLDGRMLMSMGQQRLSQLFTNYERRARGIDEGVAWVEDAFIDDSHISRSLWEAIRREMTDEFDSKMSD